LVAPAAASAAAEAEEEKGVRSKLSEVRQELEAVRHRLAIEHLKTGRIGLEELAYTLGYTDFSNFRRAFKRWQAMPPSEYRRRHLKKAGAP
jgi:AraC-like DNA-binding protein